MLIFDYLGYYVYGSRKIKHDDEDISLRKVWVILIITLAIAVSIRIWPEKPVALHNNRVEHPAYQVVSENGSFRMGLFDKQNGASEVIEAPVKISTPFRKCKDDSNLISRVLNLFTLSWVSAASCEAGPCGGNYMAPSAIDCGYNCGDVKYLYYYEGLGGWHDGWQYSGNGVCPAIDASGNCICEQKACFVY